MPVKLTDLDPHEVALRLRNETDGMTSNDNRLPILLGFFHRIFMEAVKVLQIPLDLDILNAVIVDYIEKKGGQPSAHKVDSALNGYPFQDYLKFFGSLLQSGNVNLVLHTFGFSQGFLNRLMRKLNIPYQLPAPF